MERCKAIDFILLGEPELTFSELVEKSINNQELRDVEGLAGSINGDVWIGKERSRIKDLDRLPHPARDLVDLSWYHEFFSPSPFTTILTSRGCPARCTYCVRTFGQTVGFRSVHNIVDEIEQLQMSGVIVVCNDSK